MRATRGASHGRAIHRASPGYRAAVGPDHCALAPAPGGGAPAALPFELEPEPMFGHGVFVEPDFCAGAGAAGVVLVVVELAALVAAAVGAVAAFAIPAAAPPVASAPATIVAPSILEIFMGVNLLWMSLAGAVIHVRRHC